MRRFFFIAEQQGWIRYHHSHIVLLSASQIHQTIKTYKPKTFVSVAVREDIETELIKNKLKQKQYVRNKISDLTSTGSKPKAVQSARKFFNKSGERKFVDNGTSVKVLSKVFGLSKSHTSLILRKLEKQRFIFIGRRYDDLGGHNPQVFDLLKEVDSNIFVSKERVMYKQLTSIITIRDYSFKENTLNNYINQLIRN